MTSLYPTSHRIADFPDRLPAAAITMAEVFRDAGYATVSYSSVPFSGAMTNLHQGFEELHERTSVTDAELDRESKTARVYVDRLSERGRLEELGLRDKTLIVFTSDHGEEFLEHGRMFHGQTVYGELANVPLMFHSSKGVPSDLVIDETVRSIDIMPTILDLSHLPKLEGLQGQSLVPLMAAVREANALGGEMAALAEVYGWTPAAAVTEKAQVGGVMAPPPRDTGSFGIVLDGWKLVQNTAGPGNELELYNHRDDPLNLTDVASQHPDVVQRLTAELEKWREMVLANQLPETGSTEGLSQEKLQKLRSLGYIQ